ncbi:F-box protein SKIP19-like [Silene latifolia]|uniref:F-box protein SKIP19-like n=1 Tax=Silene latifolia TaxID=37657 RepID=UPI003D770A79
MPYIWVPKSQLNPNPNPKFPPIAQSSSSNPPKINRNNKNKRRNKNRKSKNKNKIKPNWLELPEDVWSFIFSKLYTSDIIEYVQKVCRMFRKICVQPSMFRVIDMTLPDAFMDLDFDANVMTRFAVDRSAGELVDIYVESCCDDDTLLYIAERSKNLKHLRLGHYLHISKDGLIQAVQKLPMLEEVEIIICKFPEDTFAALGEACPSLKSFSLNDVGSRRRRFRNDGKAFEIARSMPNLRRLQLIGNSMTNEGLKAILDKCCLLESLDLRTCFNIDLSGDLGKKCDKIKHLRRPNDSTADYVHQACAYDDQEESEYDSDDSGMSDFLPEYLDYMDFEDYDDYFEDFDDFSVFDYFGGGFLGFGSSDSD